jgi:hypothetical protein
MTILFFYKKKIPTNHSLFLIFSVIFLKTVQERLKSGLWPCFCLSKPRRKTLGITRSNFFMCSNFFLEKIRFFLGKNLIFLVQKRCQSSVFPIGRNHTQHTLIHRTDTYTHTKYKNALEHWKKNKKTRLTLFFTNRHVIQNRR